MGKTEVDVGRLEERVGELYGKDTERAGFEAGLLRTRGDMDSEPAGPHDAFLIGYQRGERARESIIEQAVLTVEPKYNSTLQLVNLVEECEAILAAMEYGTFNTEALTIQVARARVHLADTKPGDESGEYIRPFEADTRLLGYFGELRRAAESYLKDVSPNFMSNKYDDLKAATILPPDIEAAVEGPRGRHEDRP